MGGTAVGKKKTCSGDTGFLLRHCNKGRDGGEQRLNEDILGIGLLVIEYASSSGGRGLRKKRP